MSKFIQLIEIYDEPSREIRDALVPGKPGRKFSSVETGYSLRKVLINVDHIALLREDKYMTMLHQAGELHEGLDGRQGFTKLYTNCGTSSSLSRGAITVIGNFQTIASKILGVTNAD